ncbi:Hydroxymethylpyrimidine phosphate kinase ThiD [hydrothermal vent metagenome]|uniref:Hydroxymethylpyrimidine phosphate kinase ThiD n=1 Tax=hydrothermal vent metagenome TaxID=652676 RepID=A0A3B1A8P3_9ZZZZ
MSNNKQANILVFSGLDPSGGAGIQADIETITSIGANACSIVTALTVQDTQSVQSYTNVDSEFIEQQALCILNDIAIHCIKLGMIADEKIISVIVKIIKDYPEIPLLIDPIFVAGGGGALSNSNSYQRLIKELIPLASIITPNSIEARQIVSDAKSLKECAEYIMATGCKSVLITGTHEDSVEVSNTLYFNKRVISHNWPRLKHEYHGSGCTLASSIATFIALGESTESAVYKAQQYTYNTLLDAKKIGFGQLLPNRFYLSNNHDKK